MHLEKMPQAQKSPTRISSNVHLENRGVALALLWKLKRARTPQRHDECCREHSNLYNERVIFGSTRLREKSKSRELQPAVKSGARTLDKTTCNLQFRFNGICYVTDPSGRVVLEAQQLKRLKKISAIPAKQRRPKRSLLRCSSAS